MKKLISLILILCMACMLVPAMADEDITGDWYGNMMGMGVTLTLNADGTYAFIANGQEMAAGPWKVEDGKLIAASEDSGDTIFEIKDEGLYNADMDMTMTRNAEDAPAGFVVAEPKTDAAAEEYYGEWACSGIYVPELGSVIDTSAYAAMAGDSLPNITVSADAIQFTGDGMLSGVFNLLAFQPTYADGAITAASVLEAMGVNVTVQLQMLQDGQIKAILTNGEEPIELYFAPAAAAEEPAA